MKDGVQSACKHCANKQNVAAMNKKPVLYKQYRQKAQQTVTARWKNWKRSVGCACCSEREPICLELHHKDRNTKEIQPNKLRNSAWERMMKEAVKCIMVCSNCHKKIHAGIIDDTNIPTIGENTVVEV